jgi:hypothetical protein
MVVLKYKVKQSLQSMQVFYQSTVSCLMTIITSRVVCCVIVGHQPLPLPLSANPEENTTLKDNTWTSPIIRTAAQAEFGISAGYIARSIHVSQQLSFYFIVFA